eukprot:358478-Chlamydomonas_euryale.AAC.12
MPSNEFVPKSRSRRAPAAHPCKTHGASLCPPPTRRLQAGPSRLPIHPHPRHNCVPHLPAPRSSAHLLDLLRPAQATNSAKLSGTFTGRVVEVVSGDSLVVKDDASHAERRVQLSSLRAPRMGTRDRPSDAWATEAKEFLRKKLIGQVVEVKMEYTRKVWARGCVRCV